MEALRGELADVNRQIGAIARMYQDEAQRKKLTDAQKRRRAEELRPLRQRKAELDKEIAERERNPPPRPIREAPERARRRETGRTERRLDAQWVLSYQWTGK